MTALQPMYVSFFAPATDGMTCPCLLPLLSYISVTKWKDSDGKGRGWGRESVPAVQSNGHTTKLILMYGVSRSVQEEQKNFTHFIFVTRQYVQGRSPLERFGDICSDKAALLDNISVQGVYDRQMEICRQSGSEKTACFLCQLEKVKHAFYLPFIAHTGSEDAVGNDKIILIVSPLVEVMKEQVSLWPICRS